MTTSWRDQMPEPPWEAMRDLGPDYIKGHLAGMSVAMKMMLIVELPAGITAEQFRMAMAATLDEAGMHMQELALNAGLDVL